MTTSLKPRFIGKDICVPMIDSFAVTREISYRADNAFRVEELKTDERVCAIPPRRVLQNDKEV